MTIRLRLDDNELCLAKNAACIK